VIATYFKFPGFVWISWRKKQEKFQLAHPVCEEKDEREKSQERSVRYNHVPRKFEIRCGLKLIVPLLL